MIVTKNNQTPLELATEFVNNARNVKVPEEFVHIGKTAEAEEDGPSSERILQQIEQMILIIKIQPTLIPLI